MLMVSDVNEEGYVEGKLPLSPTPLNCSVFSVDNAVQLTPSIGPVRPIMPGVGTSMRVASNCRLLRHVGKGTGAYEVVEFRKVMDR